MANEEIDIMDQIVAYSPEKLNFTFHCLDGDLFTYYNIVMNMSTIQKAIEAEEITNSFVVPFERRVVAAAITLQEFDLQYRKSRLPFYQLVESNNDPIDKKILIEIIRFVQFVGGGDDNPQNPRILYPIHLALHELIQRHAGCLIKGDFLENPDPEFDTKGDEIEVLFRYYKIRNGDFYEIRNMVEILTVDDNPELIKALLDIKTSEEYRAECARDPRKIWE